MNYLKEKEEIYKKFNDSISKLKELSTLYQKRDSLKGCFLKNYINNLVYVTGIDEYRIYGFFIEILDYESIVIKIDFTSKTYDALESECYKEISNEKVITLLSRLNNFEEFKNLFKELV